MKITKNQIIIGALTLGAIYVYSTGARRIAQAAVGSVAEAATGVVYGVSDVVGLENPDQTECAKAKAAGDTWQASFSCDATDFLKYWWEK